MGSIINLVVDMILAGATEDEIERVIKYSMAVIDAEKQSKKDYGIAELKTKYQRPRRNED